MERLLRDIEQDIDWRVSELRKIKTIPIMYNLSDTDKKVIYFYSIPGIYAIWEGYLKNSFKLFSEFLNSKRLDCNEIHINLLTHAIENQCNLGDERRNFDKKISLINKIRYFYNGYVEFTSAIPTESNADFKVTNKILERFNIPAIENTHKTPLNNLVNFRNKIAHGENSIVVEKEKVEEFVSLVENLMYEIINKIKETIEKDF